MAQNAMINMQKDHTRKGAAIIDLFVPTYMGSLVITTYCDAATRLDYRYTLSFQTQPEVAPLNQVKLLADAAKLFDERVRYAYRIALADGLPVEGFLQKFASIHLVGSMAMDVLVNTAEVKYLHGFTVDKITWLVQDHFYLIDKENI